MTLHAHIYRIHIKALKLLDFEEVPQVEEED